jgi:hypothetical protein
MDIYGFRKRYICSIAILDCPQRFRTLEKTHFPNWSWTLEPFQTRWSDLRSIDAGAEQFLFREGVYVG